MFNGGFDLDGNFYLSLWSTLPNASRLIGSPHNDTPITISVPTSNGTTYEIQSNSSCENWILQFDNNFDVKYITQFSTGHNNSLANYGILYIHKKLVFVLFSFIILFFFSNYFIYNPFFKI